MVLERTSPGAKLISGHKLAAGMATLHFGSLLFTEQCSLRVRLNWFQASFFMALQEMDPSIQKNVWIPKEVKARCCDEWQ